MIDLYLDDDSAKAALAALLRRAGHRVMLPQDAGTAGASDPRHLTRASLQGWVMLTILRRHEHVEIGRKVAEWSAVAKDNRKLTFGRLSYNADETARARNGDIAAVAPDAAVRTQELEFLNCLRAGGDASEVDSGRRGQKQPAQSSVYEDETWNSQGAIAAYQCLCGLLFRPIGKLH